MDLTGSFVLADGVLLFPASQLSAHDRRRLAVGEEDRILSRPEARSGSKVVGRKVAAVVESFHWPATIPSAVLRAGRALGEEAETLLERVFPVLERLVRSGLLVPVDGGARERITPRLAAGDRIGRWRVESALQVFEDTEVYRCRRGDGVLGAVKVARTADDEGVAARLRREASVLRRLAGVVAPQRLGGGRHEGRPYLVTSWLEGVSPLLRAAALRADRRRAGRRALLDLTSRIVHAYGRLHARGVLHGDVHPRNVMVGARGAVALLDFGAARVLDRRSRYHRGARAGVPIYYEPELAAARLRRRPAPPASAAGEQYAVAALAYLLLTGGPYLDFSIETDAILQQVLGQRPLPFVSRGALPWPGVEAALARALAKEPEDRFPSVEAFGESLAGGAADAASPPRPRRELRDLLAEHTERLGSDRDLLEHGFRSAPTASVHSGAAGAAWFLYGLAVRREDPALLAAADLWGQRALRELPRAEALHAPGLGLTEESVGSVSLFHGSAGIHAVQALIAHAMGDFATLGTAVEAFAATKPPASRWEGDLFLGGAGLLLGAVTLLEALPAEHPFFSARSLRSFAEAHAGRLEAVAFDGEPIQAMSRLGTLGAAHGWAGALYALLRWYGWRRREVPGQLPDRLEELATFARPRGQGLAWPVRPPGGSAGSEPTFVSGWCNGAAGHVLTWVAAFRATRDPRFLEIAERTGEGVWQKGDDQPHLCCGDAGRSYALLGLYRATGARRWLERARRIALAAARAVRHPSFPWHSLYRGELGVAHLGADLEAPQRAAMPVVEPAVQDCGS